MNTYVQKMKNAIKQKKKDLFKFTFYNELGIYKILNIY